MTEVCCKSLSNKTRSPFDIEPLGWWDGITRGVAKCRACRSAYVFEMVAWDSEQEVRIYGFRAITTDSYQAIISTIRLASSTPAALDQTVLRVRDALAGSFEWHFVVSAIDLTSEVLRAKAMDFAAWNAILEI